MIKVIAIDTIKLMRSNECKLLPKSRIAEFILRAIDEFELPIVAERVRNSNIEYGNDATDYLYKTIYRLMTRAIPCNVLYRLDSIYVSKFYIHIKLKELKGERRLYQRR